jgi:uncharacterized damage-inducible protein DinB
METLQLLERKVDYNDWANRRALESLRAMKSPSSRGVRALSHILLVERLWLARLRRKEIGQPPPDFFPELPLTQCQDLIDESLNGYKAYLGKLTEVQLDVVGNFETLAGSKYEASTREVLNHVMMHSMYHRGQVALAIREDGGEPLQSDFILFVRESAKVRSASEA